MQDRSTARSCDPVKEGSFRNARGARSVVKISPGRIDLRQLREHQFVHRQQRLMQRATQWRDLILHSNWRELNHLLRDQAVALRSYYHDSVLTERTFTVEDFTGSPPRSLSDRLRENIDIFKK